MAAAQVTIQNVIPLLWRLSRADCSKQTRHSVTLRRDKYPCEAAWMEEKGSSARSKPAFLPGKAEEKKNYLSFLLDAVLSQAEHVSHIWPQGTKAGLQTEFTVTSDAFLSSCLGRICWGCFGVSCLQCHGNFRQIILGICIKKFEKHQPFPLSLGPLKARKENQWRSKANTVCPAKVHKQIPFGHNDSAEFCINNFVFFVPPGCYMSYDCHTIQILQLGGKKGKKKLKLFKKQNHT